MMAVGAFNQVQSSLRWFVDNFSAIADWRATLAARRQLPPGRASKTDVLHDVESRIDLRPKPSRTRSTSTNLEIASPDRLHHARASARSTIKRRRAGRSSSARPATGKTLFFRAIAGLWPWGSGRIGLPKGENVMYMPRTPYFPPGTLREVLAYPSQPSTSFGEADFSRGARPGRPRQLGADARQRRSAGTASSPTTSSMPSPSPASRCTSRAGWSSTRCSMLDRRHHL